MVNAFVEAPDLSILGFEAINRVAGGKPAYHPAVLLKIYIYGYLNRIQSSRRLEREAQRNLELIWLTRRLAPDFKTIADFRKDNGSSIVAVCSRFIALYRRLRMKVFAHCGGRDRREQAQGGEQSGSQLHGRQDQGAPQPVGRERRAPPDRTGPC